MKRVEALAEVWEDTRKGMLAEALGKKGKKKSNLAPKLNSLGPDIRDELLKMYLLRQKYRH